MTTNIELLKRLITADEILYDEEYEDDGELYRYERGVKDRELLPTNKKLRDMDIEDTTVLHLIRNALSDLEDQISDLKGRINEAEEAIDNIIDGSSEETVSDAFMKGGAKDGRAITVRFVRSEGIDKHQVLVAHRMLTQKQTYFEETDNGGYAFGIKGGAQVESAEVEGVAKFVAMGDVEDDRD